MWLYLERVAAVMIIVNTFNTHLKIWPVTLESEEGRGGKRETHQLPLAHTHPDQGSNPQISGVQTTLLPPEPPAKAANRIFKEAMT